MTRQAFQLRPRREDDVPSLAAVLEELRTLEGYPPHWPADATALVASDTDLGAWVAEDSDGAIAGHVCLHQWSARSLMATAAGAAGVTPEGLAVVSRLFVDPHHRRRGLGRLLLDHAAAAVHALGRRPMLDVWERLPGAMALYESAGWRRVGSGVIRFRSCTDRCVHDGQEITSLVYLGPAR